MKLGLISTYVVKRETQLGYMIADESGEYFLHHNECAGHVLKDGEKVDAFLYVDKMKRIAATLFLPRITVSKGGLCEVVNVGSFGVFVHIGISRDILLSNDDLQENRWPKVGDKVACCLRTRANNLFIKLLNKQEILAIHTGEELEIGQTIQAYVYRIVEQGINLVDKDYNIIFIYHTNLRKSYRLGELVECKIISKNALNDYSATVIQQKEIMRFDDSDTILEYLNNHNGVMNFTDQTSPEILMKFFKMSKSSFKRAIGKLYKEEKIIIEEKKIILKDYMK